MITTTEVKTTYTGDGATKAFSYLQTFLAKSDLIIKERVIATGVETLYVLDTDYSISATNDDYSAGATITTLAAAALAATSELCVSRSLPQTQATDYPEANVFPAKSTEDALDKLTLIVQELERKVQECIRVPDTDPLPSRLGNTVDRAGTYLTFDATTGQPITTVVVPGESTPSASNPIITSGAGAPGSVPGKIGDIYIDTTGDVPYIAVDTIASTDFINVFDMVADTTPQLGADLDANTKAITGVTTIDTSGGYKIDTNLVFDYDNANTSIYIGLGAGLTNVSGSENTVVGAGAFAAVTTGIRNTAIGSGAMAANTTGFHSTAVGQDALVSQDTGDNNNCFGRNSGSSITSGSSNVAVGSGTLGSLTTGGSNTAVGGSALSAITTTSFNTAIGNGALAANTGSQNCAVGLNAMVLKVAGNSNCVFGHDAAETQTAGARNHAFAADGDFPSTTGSNQLNIANVIWGSNCSGTSTTAAGQVSIGSNTPSADVILELVSTTAAFRPPVMTTAERDNISTPVAGMVIFNSTTDVLNFVNNAGAWGAV